MTTKPDIRDVVFYGTEVTKESIREQSLALLNDIDEGHMHPLQVAAQFKFIEEVITNVKEELRDRVQIDIGSSGYKAQSGDIDIFVDEVLES